MIGVPEPRLDSRRTTRPVATPTGQQTARPSLADQVRDAGRTVEAGGLSGGSQSADQTPRIYDAYGPTTRFTQPGVTMAPGRLVQRISPVGALRGGVKKEYEGGP